MWTEEQKEYALSIVGNQVVGEMAQELKKHKFDIPARGAFGIGLSLKIHHTAEPIRYYAEGEIETPLTCERCTLDYAIYGVFAFCPDCGAHNSLQMLQENFEVISKLIRLGETSDAEIATQLDGEAIAFISFRYASSGISSRTTSRMAGASDESHEIAAIHETV